MFWKFEMKTMLKAKDLWGLIDGKEAKPNECDATILSTYAKKESQVPNIIIQCLSYSQLLAMIKETTTKGIWEAL